MRIRLKYTLFEHEALYLHKGEQRLSPDHLKALQLFYREKDFPYYSLVHNGIRFCEYVGVIKVGDVTIEVLPKADKSTGFDHWRKILIDMMRSVGLLNPAAPTYANLKVKNISILDTYLELFISEVEGLIHKGLIKRYRKKEINTTALKGKLLINKHISKNFIHQERFYVSQTIYDKQHLLNQIIYKTLTAVTQLGTLSHLISRYNNALLHFPEQTSLMISETLFDNIRYDRKSQDYQKAIDIAKIILLNYHPDIRHGSSHVLALMFDMNDLWEKFVLKALQRHNTGFQVHGQVSKDFWSNSQGRKKSMRPDIIIKEENKIIAVLDTKWKNIGEGLPSDDDLRQLYAYSRYHDNAQAFLLYPNDKLEVIQGAYRKTNYEDRETPGGIIKINIENGKKEGMISLNKVLTDVIARH
jgi:5-methylcytosine-specific restriction enzyme subunit McrC